MRHFLSSTVWILTFLACASSLAVAEPSAIPEFDLERVLPITTPEMRAGTAPQQTLPTRLPRPLFLIGTDGRSLAWLGERRNELRRLNAVGFVIEANSLAALKRTLNAGEGLLIVPASASDIARALGLTHYPVLLLEDRAVP